MIVQLFWLILMFRFLFIWMDYDIILIVKLYIFHTFIVWLHLQRVLRFISFQNIYLSVSVRLNYILILWVWNVIISFKRIFFFSFFFNFIVSLIDLFINLGLIIKIFIFFIICFVIFDFKLFLIIIYLLKWLI